MISFEKAKQIALDKIGPDCALIDDATLEKPYGWYFHYQSKAYLRSGDDMDVLVGNGGFIVEREGGYVFAFNTAYPLKRHFAAYEAGFKYECYDLAILSVSNLPETVDFLLKLSMTFIEPEEAYGTVWRVPQNYSEARIRSALAALPHTFENQEFYNRFETFLALDKAECCKYQLRGYRDGKAETVSRGAGS